MQLSDLLNHLERIKLWRYRRPRLVRREQRPMLRFGDGMAVAERVDGWKGDWDTFRVDAGWCYKVTWYTLNQNLQYIPYWWSTYDQVGKGDLWKKVSNNELAKITSQSSSHC